VRRVMPSLVWSLCATALLAETAGTLARQGVPGVALTAASNAATQLLAVDVLIVRILAAGWILFDSRGRRLLGIAAAAATVATGMVGPLLYLAGRATHHAAVRAGTGVVAVASLGLLGLGLGPADLRPETLRPVTEEARRRGRARLARLAERHGLTAFRTHHTLELVASDTWPGGSPWWGEVRQRFRSQSLCGSFTSRVVLLDGQRAGEVWGIQSWAAYRARSGSAAEVRFLHAAAPEIEFYLPTLQYFNELPFRLLGAPLAADAGEATLAGRRYDRVLVTWGSFEAHPEHDQYLLWIDHETGLLRSVRYTLRDAVRLAPPEQRWLMPSLALGTIHYEDYREVDGVWLPFVQTVVLPPPELLPDPPREGFFHRLEIEEARFDRIPVAALHPDPGRPEVGDRKLPMPSGRAHAAPAPDRR
jgi:hypothetical protein